MILFILLCVSVSLACHPECTDSCNSNHTAVARCSPNCAEPRCEYNCTIPNFNCETYVPECEIRCPADQCESDACPACETVCTPATVCESHNCTILCEAPSCNWSCALPAIELADGCQWNCENATCMSSSASTYSLMVATLVLFASVFCI